MNFQDVTDESTLHDILGSNGIIFKHSERCGISQDRKQALRDAFDDDECIIYTVEVREQRSLSNMIAEETGVTHESPQLLVVQDGDVVWHASHMAIDPDEVGSYV